MQEAPPIANHEAATTVSCGPATLSVFADRAVAFDNRRYTLITQLGRLEHCNIVMYHMTTSFSSRTLHARMSQLHRRLDSYRHIPPGGSVNGMGVACCLQDRCGRCMLSARRHRRCLQSQIRSRPSYLGVNVRWKVAEVLQNGLSL